jgi:hypothetical protein
MTANDPKRSSPDQRNNYPWTGRLQYPGVETLPLTSLTISSAPTVAYTAIIGGSALADR